MKQLKPCQQGAHRSFVCRTYNGKFVIVLKEVKLKDVYLQEIKFRGIVGDEDHIFRILPLSRRRGNDSRRKNFPNAVFVKMSFPTTVSVIAVIR